MLRLLPALMNFRLICFHGLARTAFRYQLSCMSVCSRASCRAVRTALRFLMLGVLLSASSSVALFLVRLPSRLSLGAFACLVCVCSLWVVALLAFFRSTLL